jgi:hypothetical protein
MLDAFGAPQSGVYHLWWKGERRTEGSPSLS